MDSHLVVFAILILFSRFDLFSAGGYCYTTDSYVLFKYCVYGCCGGSSDKYCCLDDTPVGAILGAVFGGLIVIAIIVIIIKCCKWIASSPGDLVQPPNAKPTVIMASTQQQVGFHPQQQYPPMQQGYTMGGPVYPPAYSNNSPGQLPQPS